MPKSCKSVFPAAPQNVRSKYNTCLPLMNDSFIIMEQSAEMPVEDVFEVTLEVLIALFGAIGNGLVIIVVIKLGKKKQQGDFYVQNLAVADLGILLLAFPLATIKKVAPLDWPLGEFTCHYLYPVPEIFYGASVWFIAVIAIERYRKVVIVKTPSLNKTSKFQRARNVALWVWVISFFTFCLPLYFVVEYRELPNGGKWCGTVWPSWDRKMIIARVYIGLLTFFSYILPLIVISFTYLAISHTIRRSSIFNKAMKREQYGLTEDKARSSVIKGNSIRLRQNKRAKKMLTPLVLVFAITMLPLSILRLVIAVWPLIAQQSYYKNLLFVISVFVTLNSSANPVIYSIVRKAFREQIKKLCLRRQSHRFH